MVLIWFGCDKQNPTHFKSSQLSDSPLEVVPSRNVNEESVIQALGMGSSTVAPPPPSSALLRCSPPDKELESTGHSAQPQQLIMGRGEVYNQYKITDHRTKAARLSSVYYLWQINFIFIYLFPISFTDFACYQNEMLPT